MTQGGVGQEIQRLVEIMRRLRAEGGCPWDREQDLRSLRPYLIEEAYEVLDEMDRVATGSPLQPLCEELGDLLFQIVFHAQLATELGEFSMADVCRAISDKIESRHPHVFGEKSSENPVSGTEQVLQNWAKLKAQERKKKTGRHGSVLDGVPSDAPALLRAERLTEKASRIGFDWPDLSGVWAKLEEEIRELQEAIQGTDRDALEMELGDVLFSLANVARFIKTPPEDALRQANRRFTARFHEIEAGLEKQGIAFGEATLVQMEALWQQAKEKHKLIPPPRAPARAGISVLRLPSPHLEKTGIFWERLVPFFGWQKQHAPDGERRYSDGGQLLLVFFAGQAFSPPAQLCVDAPSRWAVDVLHTAIAKGTLPDAQVFTTPTSRESGYGFDFQDPSGLALTYAFRSG